MMFLWGTCTQRIGLIYLETFAIIGSTAIPMIIAPLLYEGETVSLLQWVGVLCLLIAVIVLSLKQKVQNGTSTTKVKENKNGKIIGIIYVLLLILSYVGASVSQKLYPTLIGQEYTAYFNLMTFIVVLICFSLVLISGKIFKKKTLLPENSIQSKKLFLYVFVAAVMIYVYQYFSTLAAGMLPSAIFYPLIKGISMLLTVLCDVLIYKQKMTKNTVIGLLFVFTAIILINV